MKRFGNLFDKIWTFDNLLAAFYKARIGKRKNPNVAAFEVNLEWELLRLSEELRTGTYRPGPYRTFFIHDPKKRMISAAPFRDRVVHHALCNVIEPLFEPTLIADTYANRQGKGTHAGIRRCQQFARRSRYVLKADIRKYFPSIDHELLKGIIARKIKCRRTLRLIDLIIDNSNPQEEVYDYFPGDDLFTPVLRKKGLPMGNLTSQFFANLYLSPLDHFVVEELRMPGYVRYVDDFVVFQQDKSALHEAARRINGFLNQQLRLKLHPLKTAVFPTKDGITFLGQRVFTTHRRLKRENVQRFKKRLNERLGNYLKGEIAPETFETQLNSWLGHARQADTWQLRRKMFWLLRSQGLWLFEKGHSWKLLERPRRPSPRIAGTPVRQSPPAERESGATPSPHHRHISLPHFHLPIPERHLGEPDAHAGGDAFAVSAAVPAGGKIIGPEIISLEHQPAPAVKNPDIVHRCHVAAVEGEEDVVDAVVVGGEGIGEIHLASRLRNCPSQMEESAPSSKKSASL
jgi:retron-type reverse transcriptase